MKRRHTTGIPLDQYCTCLSLRPSPPLERCLFDDRGLEPGAVLETEPFCGDTGFPVDAGILGREGVLLLRDSLQHNHKEAPGVAHYQ